MDRDDRVSAIVRAAEHLLDLGRLDFLIERLERPAEFGIDLFAGLGPFDEDREVIALLAKGFAQIAILLQPFPSLEDFLGFRLVVPEIGSGSSRLETRQLVLRAGGFKDSSGDRRRAARGLRIVASSHQRWASDSVPFLRGSGVRS